MKHRFWPLGPLVMLLALGCGRGSSEATTAESEAASLSGADPAPSDAPTAPPPREGTIARAQLEPILEAGLGHFLGGVRTEPHLEGRSFVGWRVVSFYPEDERFEDIPLQPGDTVTRVNGQPVERPEQAFQVWSGLRVASALVVEFLHDGEPRTMRYEIVD